MGWISSLAASIGAPLAAGLVNRFLVLPYQEQIERQKQVDNPLAFRRGVVDLNKSIMGEYGSPQTPEEAYGKFPLMTSLAAGMEPEKFAPFVGQYGMGRRLMQMTPAEEAAERAKAGLYSGQEAYQRAHAKATEMLAPAQVQEHLSTSLLKGAMADKTAVETSELAKSMAANIDLKKAQAELGRANAEALKTGDKSGLTKALLESYKDIYPQIKMGYAAANKGGWFTTGMSQGEIDSRAHQDTINMLMGVVGSAFPARQTGQAPTSRQTAPVTGNRPPWLDARPPAR
jgi:hypothetical protein